MNYQNASRAALFCGLLILSACGKKDVVPPQAAGKAVVDTNQKAEPVQIADTNHHLYFRPVVGSVQRYHIVDRTTSTSSDQLGDGPVGKVAGSSTSEFFLRQTVKSVAKDSSVELVIRIDSIELRVLQDTTTIRYSSSSAKDRADDRFRDFNILLGKKFTIKTDKYGDLSDITDVDSIAAALLAGPGIPDSLRASPRVKMMATRHIQELADSYVMRILVHSPTRALIKDTTWHNVSEVNLDIAKGLSFPVKVEATETVHGLEKRGDKVLAVLEDRTTTTPKQRIFDEGATKTTVSNFLATSHSLMRIDDATGLLVHKTMEDKRSFTFVIESKQKPGQKRSVTQDGTETMTSELIE